MKILELFVFALYIQVPMLRRPATTGCKYIISSTEIASLPVLNFGGRIKLINADSSDDDEQHIRDLLGISSSNSIVGLDTESKPSSLYSKERNRTALIQIAGENACVLWRLVGRNSLPKSLVNILADPQVAKVGQGISSDVCYLKEDFENVSATASFVDLYKVSLRLQCQPKSLQGMVGIFLGKRLLKDMRISNWEAENLRQEQIQYAAVDAWVSRAVAVEMINRGISVKEIGNVTDQEIAGRQNSGPSASHYVTGTPFGPGKLVVTPSTEELLSPKLSRNIDASLVKHSGSAQVRLVDLCVSRQFLLKIGGFEMDKSQPGRFRCKFNVVVKSAEGGRETVSSSSAVSHTSMRAAQEDAAAVMISLLENRI